MAPRYDLQSYNQRTARKGNVLFILFWLQQFLCFAGSVEEVFFNQYGHCSRNGKPFDLDEDMYVLSSMGGSDAYDSMVCTMAFKSTADHEICLTFLDFSISDCGVSLKIYDNPTASGRAWETLTCHDRKPSKMMCTTSHDVTVSLNKNRESLKKYKDCNVKVLLGSKEQITNIAESDTETGYVADFSVPGKSGKGGKASSSPLLIVGCILGGIVLVAALAAVALFFCKHQKGVYVGGASSQDSEIGERAPSLVVPSAPPEEEPPPPYVPPPPYDGEFSTGRSTTHPTEVVYENTPMMKNR